LAACSSHILAATLLFLENRVAFPAPLRKPSRPTSSSAASSYVVALETTAILAR